MEKIKSHEEADNMLMKGIQGDDIVKVVQEEHGYLDIELKNGQTIEVRYDGESGVYIGDILLKK